MKDQTFSTASHQAIENTSHSSQGTSKGLRLHHDQSPDVRQYYIFYNHWRDFHNETT